MTNGRHRQIIADDSCFGGRNNNFRAKSTAEQIRFYCTDMMNILKFKADILQVTINTKL